MTTNTLASVTKNAQDTSTKPNYSVKNIEPVVIGTDVQARIFTLAAGLSRRLSALVTADVLKKHCRKTITSEAVAIANSPARLATATDAWQGVVAVARLHDPLKRLQQPGADNALGAEALAGAFCLLSASRNSAFK